MQLSNQLSARGQMSMLAANERRIEELKAYLGDTDQREKLLEEELQYSEHFRFEDLRENEDFKRGSRVDGSVMNDRYRYINDPAYRNEYQLGLIQSQPGAIVPRNDLYEAGLDMLTAEEKAMYNYCYSTGGAELAEEYLRHKAQELIQRKAGQEFEGVKGQVLPELLFAAPAGVDSFEQGLKGWFGGETPVNVRQTLGGMIREDLAQAGPQMPGWTGGASLGQMAYDTINTTANMAPSILVGTLGQMFGLGGAGTVALAASAGGNARQEAIREGYTEEQATAYGTMIGAAEGILSELLGGISALGGKGLGRFTGGKFAGFLNNLDNAFLRVGAELGEKMLSEGTEEYVQEIIEPLIRNAAFGEENDLELYTPEALYSGLLGAITGGVMEGPSMIGKAGKGKKANTEPQKASTVPKPEGGEYTGFVDDGGAAPSVAEGDSSPIPDGTGEPMGDGTQAAPYEGKNGTKAPDNGTTVTGVPAQDDAGDVQKEPETADENGGKADEGEHLLHGGPERHDAPGAGEPAERYEVRRERQQAEARSQTEAAAQRRVKAENLERLGKAQRVSSKDLGLKQGTEVRELLELPRYEWDEALWETVSRIEKETGYKVRTVTGNIGVRLKGGGVGLSRGYIDRVSGTIVMNVAHTQVTAGQIADHELWHWKMDTMDRVSGDRYEMTRAAVQRIQEEYDPEDFDAVLDKYIDGYGDVYDMDAPDFLDRIYEEIIADAYAGINAFGTDAAKFRSTVDAVMAENGMGRNVWNAQEQEGYAAPGGDQRVYTDEDAPPPRDEDFSQEMPEYDWGDFDPDDALFSYAGENARNADREALERAQRMEEQGFDRKDIFRDTGWFRGADGKWRFEIDDSGMKYRRGGDAQFRRDHPEYVRYMELEEKFIEGTIKPDEVTELMELHGTWGREYLRLYERVDGGVATLRNMIEHDDLFEQYPALADVKVRFADLGQTGGYWSKKNNEIVLHEQFRGDPEAELIHEIQHAIQDVEGFAGGASPEYWEVRQNTTEAIHVNDHRIEKAQKMALKAIEGLAPEVVTDFWYAANMEEQDPEGAKALQEKLEADGHADAFGDYYLAMWILQEVYAEDNPKRTAMDLYRSTAGEIEARDTQRLAKQEQVSEADMLDSLAEKLERELAQFAHDAEVEMKLRGYTRKNIGERMHRQLTRERLQRAADKAHYRETMQIARNRRELNKLQERTLKTLQWLNKNKYRASEEIQAQIQEVLSDIDLYAVGAANELNWHPKYEMTWRDLAEVYKASKDSPNFIPSAELDRIVARLDNRKIEELDVNALNDLFNAAVGLRKEIFDAEKALSFATDQEFDKIYQAMTTEMHLAKKPKKGSVQDKFFNIEQLTPMNVLRQMGGWRPDGTFAKMAGVLEQGEKEVRAYKVKANRILADWLEAHRDWVHKADGQGKDGIWIEVDVPRLEGIGLDGGATFGDTVKVKMTPMQRVHLYLESRNEDNLRHMVGGRTFADPELYSQGKRTEAYAQGITVKMAPETVKALVANMTQEELELARLLDSYYNGLAHDEINRVSNKLYGYNKAMGKRYAPIFTNQNFTKSEAGIFDQTAEGVGNLKERVKAKNPSYNISALDAFERNVDKTAEFVGMAIPVRDWNSLMNWRTKDSSMKDQITHEWGQDRLEYIDKLLVDLQGGAPTESDVMQELGDKLLSNYISSIFGFNPSIILKQAGSLPLAAAYLGAENMSFDMLRKERRSREFIAKYTQELQWRSMGYDMPETKQLKDKPGWAQKSGKKWVEDVFGGGYITKMDEATASVLWAWAENKVRAEHPGLEVGDQKTIDEGNSPFYKKVSEEFDRAVSHSQSVSDVAHQSTMRRSKGVLARTFTMFRSDSAQTYNALRQMWGEKEYWEREAARYTKPGAKQSREKALQAELEKRKSAKRIGTVVVAMASNALLAELVDFAMAAIKGKLDRYEDEEEERLTALSVLGEMFGGILESGGGVVVFGDEAAALLGRLITGEKGYGEEAPGLEQLLDLVDRFETAVAGVKKGDILGAVREVGMAFSTYYAGFPAENMEKFLISGLGKHLAPGLVAGYEDMLEAPTKSDLKGMKGAALETRLGHVMKEYGLDLNGEARAALAKIYEAGYTDAVPSAAPAKVTIDGRERKLGKQAQRQYDKIRAQVVNGELAAVLASPFFQEADGKTQAKMLKRLYDFAGEKAKEEVLEDYESDSTALVEYTEIAQAGGSIADCVIFQTETADMKSYMKADLLREWDAGDEAKRLMFHHLISGSYEEELEKLGKAGLGVDQFLELYAMHGQIDGRDDISATDKATEFAYWLDGQRYTQAQKAAVRDELPYFQFTPAKAAKYNTATEAGLDRTEALELTEDLMELGKDPKDVQKWRVGIDNAWGPENQLQQLKAVGMDDATYAKCEALWNAGVAPAAYVRAKELESQFNEDGKGTLKNEEWTKLINSLVPSGIALPGDNERFNMTNEQMGFLWQMLTGSKSTKNNPFSAAGGEKWLAIKNADK